MSSQTTSSTPGKAAKRGRKPKSRAPSNISRICASSFAIRLGNLGETSLIHICGEYIPKALHGVALVNYNERDTTVSGESSFYNIFWNFVCKKNPLLSSENKLVFHCANQQKHVLLCLLCWQNDRRNPKLFHLSWFVSALARVHFFCRCVELIYQTFPQSRSAKLQQLLPTEEDEQQALSVHPWAKKRWNFSY